MSIVRKCFGFGRMLAAASLLVGPMAAQAAIFFMSSFWRMLTRVRLASRMLVSISL